MQNSYIFIKENAFENVFCEMVAIFPQPQYVNCLLIVEIPVGWPSEDFNSLRPSDAYMRR